MDTSSIRGYPPNIVFLGNSLPIKVEYKETKEYHSAIWKHFEEFFYYPCDSWKDVDIRSIV